MDEKNCNQKTVNKDVENAWICPECNDSQYNHRARGMCSKCYHRWLRRKHGILPKKPFNRPCQKCGKSPVIGQDMCHSCYKKNYRKNHNQERLQNEKKRFGGRRDKILQVYQYMCAFCGMLDDDSVKVWGTRLIIHHKDGNNMNSDTPNHNIKNLKVLCKRCHASLHHKQETKQGVKKCV